MDDRIPAPVRFVPLVTLGDLAAARVWAARLESEGVEVRLRGESLGPYPMTVGAWGATEIWVPDHALEQARMVVLEAEVDDAMGGGVEHAEALPVRALALVVALLVAVAVARAVLWVA